MTISEYIQRINERYRSGRSTEHSYRGDLLNLLETLLPDLAITNEPKRIEAGAPDYILTRNGIPAGFIEAKDLGDPDLAGKKKHKEQFNRYKATQDPFIFTDYLDFHLYLQGAFIASIRIADIEDGEIVSRPERFEEFRDLIRDFVTHTGQTIRSAAKLSKMMAGKARLLSDVIERALLQDEKTDGVNEAANNSLREQLAAFQNVLIHDIDAEEFADIYAQTIAYGMFAARLHDPTLDTFSRHEAAELIPKTNPFLRKLFQYIAGYDLDDRLVWIVDALADIFRATDVAALLEDFGKATRQNDPIIHFYETFLAEFDPALRKSRGVWYTPEPVVNFIVRAVDDILKDEFDLKDGLADTSKTTVKVNTDVKDKRSSTGYKQEEREVHKVQILDPAAGTGTFLAEVIQQIYQQFDGQQGLWPSYVENHLIPRLNGFELLMASYAMAHLKLDMLLRETGYDRESSQRFRVFLTNSLEEHHPDTGTLFANWLSEEANQANRVKRDTPVMVVMGNPPYSGESANKGDWIMELMEDYKKEPGGKKKLQERNPKWINDDYVKFMRYGQHFVEKNGEGVLAFINPHGFLDNPTFRGMRWNLLKTYDKIYTIDLHGNT
ncbi:MAG: N-6 DNA methylase, partial [Balneolaceae bacterium]|nr:N-6 DNA methylase [Balneolaceae bacterium]